MDSTRMQSLQWTRSHQASRIARLLSANTYKKLREKRVQQQHDNEMSPQISIAQVAIASFIGTAIEWYDFFLYGTAAALIFNRLFFPTFEPLVGTLAAFGTYAVGFIARPVGGIVFGHYGDKIGRKSMLSLTLLLMGTATFCIGLLPTYGTLGVWAPLLLVLLRVLQGFGVGGEWGGAVLMAVDHAPVGKRGFYGSWPQVGVPAGLLLSTGVFSLVSTLPEDQLLARLAQRRREEFGNIRQLDIQLTRTESICTRRVTQKLTARDAREHCHAFDGDERDAFDDASRSFTGTGRTDHR